MYKRVILLTLILILLLTGSVYAHGGDTEAASILLEWSIDPAAAILIMVTTVLYLRGWKKLAGRTSRLNTVRISQFWAFIAGILTTCIALFSPIHHLAEELFWIHMVQHSLLMLVAAPLLILGNPLPAVLLGLPQKVGRLAGVSWQRVPFARTIWHWLTLPASVWLLHTAVLWGWHAPDFYQASLTSEFIHAIQHASFIIVALLFWWVVFHTYGAHAERRGTGILYLFTTALQSGTLGALITMSSQTWYPAYRDLAAGWGLTAMEDQQIAGTIMWVPGGLGYLFTALWMLKTWLDSYTSSEAKITEEDIQ